VQHDHRRNELKSQLELNQWRRDCEALRTQNQMINTQLEMERTRQGFSQMELTMPSVPVQTDNNYDVPEAEEYHDTSLMGVSAFGSVAAFQHCEHENVDDDMFDQFDQFDNMSTVSDDTVDSIATTSSGTNMVEALLTALRQAKSSRRQSRRHFSYANAKHAEISDEASPMPPKVESKDPISPSSTSTSELPRAQLVELLQKEMAHSGALAEQLRQLKSINLEAQTSISQLRESLEKQATADIRYKQMVCILILLSFWCSGVLSHTVI
jgi:hypothetical protein